MCMSLSIFTGQGSVADNLCLRFYNLAVHPELVSELREEARTVLAQHNNQFTSAAMQNLKKLDSVLKESMRVDPASFCESFLIMLQAYLIVLPLIYS